MTRVSLPALYELCEELRRDDEDPAQVKRFEAWAKGKAGVSVRRDGPDACWEWTAATGKGYGKFSTIRPRTVQAHRFAYELLVAPAGALMVLHGCDNRRCVNPAHLRLGTAADNSRDMVSRGRAQRGDMNSSRRRSDRVARGDRHCSRTHPERVPRGEAHGGSRLTEASVVAIRLRYANGERPVHLAASFGVDEATIRKVVRRQRWAHVATTLNADGV